MRTGSKRPRTNNVEHSEIGLPSTEGNFIEEASSEIQRVSSVSKSKILRSYSTHTCGKSSFTAIGTMGGTVTMVGGHYINGDYNVYQTTGMLHILSVESPRHLT